MADEYEEIETEESERRYARNKSEARGNLFDAKLRDRNIQREDALEADRQNAAAAENEWWGSKLGGWGSAGLAFALGLANPFALAAIAGAGSFFGGQKGAENVGGYAEVDDIRLTTFGGDTAEDTREAVSSAKKSAESSRLMSAGSTAFSVYNLAGGPIPGTDSWTGKADIALADNLTNDEVLSQLTDKYLEEGMTSEAATSLAKQNTVKAFQPDIKGIIPDSLNEVADLGYIGKNVDDVSNMNVLWENLVNPNKKGSLVSRGTNTATLFDLLSSTRDYLNEEPV